MKLSVCILSWNTTDIMFESMEVILKELKDIESEIIIVDNGSDDNIQDLVCMYSKRWDKELKLQLNIKNEGISVGKNQCIEMAVGEYVLLLDGDIIPVANSIKCMIEFLDDNPDKHTIGMYPNKWTNQKNTEKIKYAEEWCESLVDPKEHVAACLFYGMYRRSETFDKGLRCCEDDIYLGVGYGWEDHDFFMRQKEMGVKQYVAHINNMTGHYYHHLNSSIRAMGKDKYMETSRARGKAFKDRWKRGS